MKPITQENDRVGFIGVGYMGRPIARRLLESGFKVTAYDRDHHKAEELIPYGGAVAQTVSELSSGCSVVLSCLPNDEAVWPQSRASVSSKDGQSWSLFHERLRRKSVTALLIWVPGTLPARQIRSWLAGSCNDYNAETV